MKKFLLSLAAVALLATTVSAAKINFKPTHNNGEVAPKEQKAPKMNSQRFIKKAALKSEEDFPIITEAPEGTTEYILRRSGDATYVYWFWAIQTVQDNMAMRVFVDLPNMKVYIKDPISNYPTGAFVEGDIVATDDGFQLVVPLGQNLSYDEDYDAAVQLQFLIGTEVEEDGEIYYDYNLDTEAKYALFSLDIATMSATLLGSDLSEQGENYVLGAVWSDDESWSGYADWNSAYTLCTDTPEPGPENPEEGEIWYLQGFDYSGSSVLYPVNVVLNADNIYIQGAMEDLPEGWIKGDVEDTEVSVTTPQYMGITEGNWFIYTTAAVDNESADEDAPAYALDSPLTFTLDAENKVLTMTSQYLLFNCAPDEFDGYSLYSDVVISYIEDKPATPADPEFSWVEPYDEDYGYGYASIVVYPEDAEGNPVRPELLNYKFWKEEGNEMSPVEFTPEDYEMLVEPMTEIPYDFSDGWDFNNFGNEKTIYFNFDFNEWDRLGVQTVYYGGAEANVSEIVWWELSSVKGINADKAIASAVYYDMTGRRIAKPAQGGVYIKSIKYTDGTVANVKVLVK